MPEGTRMLMPNPDARLWSLLDRAIGHLILARFGGHSAAARSNLYARAAELLTQVADAVLERAEAEAMEPAERMVRRIWR